MEQDNESALVKRTEHAKRVLEECSADRLGAMLRFADEERAAAARRGSERDPHDLIAEGFWRLHVPEATDWAWGYDVSQFHAAKYRKAAKLNTRESVSISMADSPSERKNCD